MSEHVLTFDPKLLCVSTSHLSGEFSVGANPYTLGPDMNYVTVRTTEADGLMTDFRLALKRLEGLLYVSRGANPKSYRDGENYWLHADPRILWPEQEFDHTHDATSPAVDDYSVHYWQTAARGIYGTDVEGGYLTADTGYFDWARSVDLLFAYARSHAHNTEFFPAGVITKPAFSGNYGDPLPTDNILITYAAPAAIRDRVSTVSLIYKVNGGTASTLAMTTADDGETYTATIPNQADGSFITYHLKIVTSDTTPLAIYEPPGTDWATEPTHLAESVVVTDELPIEDPPEMHHRAEGCFYYLKVMTHAGVYAGGLPEFLWETHTHPEIRRCTGTWRFETLQNVTAGLVNVARFALDSFGRSVFQHDPQARGPAPSCCIDMPIRFRWSGSARYPLFQDGGKSIGEGDPSGPTTNHPLAVDRGHETARAYWRGCPAVFNDIDNMAFSRALLYGNDESWLSWPHYVKATCSYVYGVGFSDPDWHRTFDECGMYRGLHAEDRISIDHVREIINAVNYLCETNGLWWTRELETCRRTPTNTVPIDEYVDDPGYSLDYNEGRTPDETIIEWCGGVNGEMFCNTAPPMTPFSQPATIAECRDPSSSSDECVVAGRVPFHLEFFSGCHDGVSWHTVSACYGSDGDSFRQTCNYMGEDGFPDHLFWEGDQSFSGGTDGYSFWLCGPSAYYLPVGSDAFNNQDSAWSDMDEDHGSNPAASKTRSIYSACGSYGSLATNASMGNKADAAVACHSERTLSGLITYKQVSFDTVTPVQFNGIAQAWAVPVIAECNECSPSSTVDEVVPPLPTFTYWGEPDEDGDREDLCYLANLNNVAGGAGNEDILLTPTENLTEYQITARSCANGDPKLEEVLIYWKDPENPGLGWILLGGNTGPDASKIVDGAYETIGTVDLVTMLVAYAFTEAIEYKVHVSWSCVVDSQGAFCSISLTDKPNCNMDSPRVYMRVDLNKDEEGVPQLYPYDLTIVGTGDVYPDETGLVFDPCIG